MHIGLMIYGSLETISGGYLYDRKLVEHLRHQGDQVEIISLPRRHFARNLLDNFSPALFSRLAGSSLDILLQDELNHPSLFWINHRIKARSNYLIVSIVHHLRSSELRPGWQNHFYGWIEWRYLSSVDGFIYNSQTTREVVENLIERKPPSVVAYPAGDRLGADIGEDEIIQRIQKPGPLRLLFLGNAIPRKGLHTLLAALEKLPAREWRLQVIGSLEVDRPYVRIIQSQIARSGLEKNVYFSGSISDGELAAQMRDSHLLVVPSSYEGFGIVYLEAMGFGLPAIATTSGAAGEIIIQGENGYLIAPGDAPALAGYLRELAQDRRRLLRLSLAARQRYESHPSWEKSMQKIRTYLHFLQAGNLAPTAALE